MNIQKTSRWLLVAVVLGSFWAVPSFSDDGLYHPDRHWASIYFREVFTVDKAEALGYVLALPECVPGMGYHYVKPDEAEAWFEGRSGGIQVLLYDKTEFLVGVEYVFTAPSLNSPAPLGMSGPSEGHIPGMPFHYEQHIYFSRPECPGDGHH